MAAAKKSSYYGKRPLWQWIVLYLIIGGIVYAGIYYFFIGQKGGYSASTQSSGTPQQSSGY